MTSLFGNDGDDYLLGGADFDGMHGGAGNDWLWGGLGGDRISGGSGIDHLFGELGDDSFYYDDGDDMMTDIVDGGAGYDTIHFDYYQQPSTALTLTDAMRIECVVGNGDVDYTFHAAAMKNAIRLVGGIGDDQLNGGAGDDLFVMNAPGFNWTVTDFESGGDKVEIVSAPGAPLLTSATLQPLMQQVGNDTVIDYGGSHMVLQLTGVATLTASDFAFSKDPADL